MAEARRRGIKPSHWRLIRCPDRRYLACAALVAAQAILLRCQIERPNGNVVLGIEYYLFDELIENYKLTKGVIQDTELVLNQGEWSDWVRIEFESIPRVE